MHIARRRFAKRSCAVFWVSCRDPSIICRMSSLLRSADAIAGRRPCGITTRMMHCEGWKRGALMNQVLPRRSRYWTHVSLTLGNEHSARRANPKVNELPHDLASVIVASVTHGSRTRDGRPVVAVGVSLGKATR